MQNRTQPATASEIVRIIGAADDALITEIIDTGATAAEVLEAFTWMNADDQLGTELERGPRGATIRVYEILKREGPEENDQR